MFFQAESAIMALVSAMQSALSGLSAAETSLSIIANNIANAQTAGFKASHAIYATQTPQTAGPGVSPSGLGGGGNPVQIGRGVSVVGLSTDTSPGELDPLGHESSNTDLAHSIIELGITSDYFRANLQTLDTSLEMLDELANLGRR
jgi:flagellar hook protein FlgE